MSLSTVVLTTSLMLLRDTNRRYSKKCFQNLSSQLRLNVLLTSTSSRFNQVGDIVTGNPDYPYVRAAITTQNPPIYE